jgi:hypothetical protein
MEPKPLSLERRQQIEGTLSRAPGVELLPAKWYAQDVADLLQEVERLEEEVRQARRNRQ